jgi:hypothetical protein
VRARRAGTPRRLRVRAVLGVVLAAASTAAAPS